MDKAVPSSLWATEGEVVDPSLETLRIPGPYVLVRPIAVIKESKGGIIIPDIVRDDMEYLNTLGRVLKLGEMAYDSDEYSTTGEWCNEGDYVIFPKYAGHKFIFDDVKLLLLREQDVLMTLSDPSKILGGKR